MTSTATVHKTQRLVARQDANHRIVYGDDSKVWTLQHRGVGWKEWSRAAFILNFWALEVVLARPSIQALGYKPLMDWTLAPKMRAELIAARSNRPADLGN